MQYRSKSSESCFAGILQNCFPKSLFEELVSKHYGLDRTFSRNSMAKPSIRRFCNVQPSDRAGSARHPDNRADRAGSARHPGNRADWAGSARHSSNRADRAGSARYSDKPPGFPLKALISIKNTPIQLFVLRWNYSGADRIAGNVYCRPKHI